MMRAQVAARGRLSIGLLIITAQLAAAGLSSCSPHAVLVVGPASPQLRQELAKLAAGYSRSDGLRIAPADKAAPRGVTVAIDWSFPDPNEQPGLFSISKESAQKSGFSTAHAFELLLGDGKDWREMPILWDAWGTSSTPEKGVGLDAGATFEWQDRGTLLKVGQALLAPGGESGTRQSLFWFANAALPEQGALDGTMLGGDERSGTVGLGYFKAFAALTKDKAFSTNSFGMMKVDVENLAKGGKVGRLFGDYQWLRGIPGAGPRDFRALVYPLHQGRAMPVSLLSGRVLGSGATASKAKDFLLWLLSPENQKELSEKTGYMAANFKSANLDLNALKARDSAIASARIVLIDPEPRKGSAAESWDTLLGWVLAKPAELERILAEARAAKSAGAGR